MPATMEVLDERSEVCLVMTSLLVVKCYLLGHLTAISRKYKVTLIVNVDDQDFLDSLKLPITVIPVNIVRKIALWQDLKALWRLIGIFRAHRFNLVHSISPKAGLLGMAAAWITGVPNRIHTFQGEVWANRRGWQRAVLRFADKIVASAATRLTIVSYSERRFLIDEKIISADKSIVLANGSICGVDTSRFHADPIARRDIRGRIGADDASVVVLFLGRINRDKGVLDLAAAFAEIAANAPQARLLLVGPDEEGIVEEVRRICSEYADRIEIFDFTPHPERFMAAADILCLPSYREGFGLVIIEAAATGIPSVCSRIYGITDAVADKTTGLLFPAGNRAELATHLSTLIEDRALREKMGAAARARAVDLFNSSKITAEMLALYSSLEH